jgi:hypothetical protein
MEAVNPEPIEPRSIEPVSVEQEDERPTVNDHTIVIDPGDGIPPERQTLLEAASAERERRRTAPPPTIFITNENLAEHATGDLTVIGGRARGGPKTDTARGGNASASAAPAERGEDYWRQRILSVRSDWKQTLEEINHLEGRVAQLRRKFYAEDDAYYRDTQIKPSWDRTLERLQEAREVVGTYRDAVDRVLEEGRHAGALPGWLREGIELEPKVQAVEEPEDLPEHQPQEPTIAKDPGMGAP